MELKVDLLKEKWKKSFSSVILGICAFLVASSWIISKFIENAIIQPFDWFYCGFFALLSVGHCIRGLYPVENFFGKAYILINSELISLKATVFDKEQLIAWREIKSIDYKLNKFEIKKTDNTRMGISLSKFNCALKGEIKEMIHFIANEKNIQSNC